VMNYELLLLYASSIYLSSMQPLWFILDRIYSVFCSVST
jgi:hypothetical protein